MKKTLIATTLVATAAAGTTVLVAGPASADVERRGTCAGATIGAKADTDRNRPGFFNASVSAPCPPIEWPVIPCRRGSIGKWSATSCGSSSSK